MNKGIRAFLTIAVAIGITRLVMWEVQRHSRKKESPAVDVHRWEGEGGNVPEVETVTPRTDNRARGSAAETNWNGHRDSR